MKATGVRLSTQLSVRDLGCIFQESTQRMYGAKEKFAKFVRGFTQVSNNFEYFTPRDDSPFSALDDDKPTFSVGVTVPKFAGTGDGEVTLHMYVWDRGTVREVMLASPHTFASGSSARRAVDRVLNQIRFHDGDVSAHSI